MFGNSTASNQDAIVPGRIALITFASSGNTTGERGFDLHIYPNGDAPTPNVTTASRDFSSNGQQFGTIKHPFNENENYNN